MKIGDLQGNWEITSFLGQLLLADGCNPFNNHHPGRRRVPNHESLYRIKLLLVDGVMR